MCIRDRRTSAEILEQAKKLGREFVIQAEGTVIAVSYTHLDVYKRQANRNCQKSNLWH